MNISLQNVDKVSALLTVNIEKADYQEKVEKVLKTYRQKANCRGLCSVRSPKRREHRSSHPDSLGAVRTPKALSGE